MISWQEFYVQNFVLEYLGNSQFMIEIFGVCNNVFEDLGETKFHQRHLLIKQFVELLLQTIEHTKKSKLTYNAHSANIFSTALFFARRGGGFMNFEVGEIKAIFENPVSRNITGQ